MSKIRALLWDIDATILNFEAAEKVALRMGFERMNMGECSDEMIQRYIKINRRYWEALERGEITKPEVLVGRYREFFETEGLPVENAEEFNEHYQTDLGETICFNDEANVLLPELAGEYKQYVVSNGTKVAQDKKLDRSGLRDVFDAIFISEEVGAEKPSPIFFEAVLKQAAADGITDKQEMLIIGDSLTSDIRGGNNAGIPTVWYNPAGKPNTEGVQVDYEIRNLNEIRQIL